MKHTESPSTTVLTTDASKQLIDEFLTPLFAQLSEDARRISPHYETLWQDITKLYSAGGKRFRSYVTLLTYEAFCSAPFTNIIPAAAAQELLHIAMLIHDDIIDRDDMRYGVKNIAREYLDHYEELITDTADRRHYANSAAILAGDLMVSQAYNLITEANVKPSVMIESQKLITKAIFQVIGGELLDTEASFRGTDSADPLVIAEQKTASYSFVSPFLMGATLAEADASQKELLEKLGEELGIAYQLRDDLLGVFGDEAETGKSTDGDLRQGKHTLLIQEFQKRATLTQNDEFFMLFGHADASVKAIERMKALLTETGAKEAIETLITSYQEHTHTLVAALKIDDAHKTAFDNLIDMCLKRAK